MTRRFMSAVAVGVLAATAMVAGPIAAASASNVTLKRDLVRAVPKLKRSELRVAAATKHFESTGSPAHLIGPPPRAQAARRPSER
jgi:outer membrane protein W